MASRVLIAAVILACSCMLPAQVSASLPHLDVALLASGIPASGTSMAADRFGNVYILHDPGLPTAVGPYVSRVRPDGTVDAYHAVGLVAPGQLRFDPADGNVYLLDVLGAQTRLEQVLPAGGLALVATLPLVARGLAIDDNGLFFLGASSGPSGSGIYLADPVSMTVTWLGVGFGANGRLLALHGGDILIADVAEVRRFAGGMAPPTPFHQIAAQPQTIAQVLSMTRDSLNGTGAGVVLGRWFLNTQTFSGNAEALHVDPQGAGAAVVAVESWQIPANGMQAVASGQEQDLYWYTTTNSAVAASGTLYRIRQQPAAGVQGSYLATKTATTVTLRWYGPPAGGNPLIAGLTAAPVTSPPLYLPARGLLALNPLDPAWLPLLDGVGLFGPPNPLAVTGPGGLLQLSAGIPPLTSSITVVGQAVIISALAPNQAFFITNTDSVTLP